MRDEILANLKKKLKVNGGPFDEGQDDRRDGRGTGSVIEWSTDSGDVYVVPGDRWYKGDVAVHFSGLERKTDYKSGEQKSSHETPICGKVAARYSIDRDDVVFITQVTKQGGLGRVGDAVVRHVQSVNETPL